MKISNSKEDGEIFFSFNNQFILFHITQVLEGEKLSCDW